MVDMATITAAITAATSGVALIDKIADEIDRFLTGRSNPAYPKEHRAQITKDGDAIVSKINGREYQRITAQDLEKLPYNLLRHIQVLERSMENHYSIWAAVYPQLALAVDPIAKAKTEQQLEHIIADMRMDLSGILHFLETAGLRLDDHYWHIRQVVGIP